MAKVYGMYNQTKKQRYYGRTTRKANHRNIPGRLFWRQQRMR